jgi:hypothetical protein
VLPLVLFSDVCSKQSKAKPFSKQQALFINKGLDSRNADQKFTIGMLTPPKKQQNYFI